MGNNVKSYGKIRFIEPNDILENNIQDYNSSLNINHPYENYSISVDLIVEIPNRMGIANDKTDTYSVSLDGKNYNGGKISFFTGTDGYLTDIPTSIVYNDILNSNNNLKENLGITQIHVSYNSYFYPEVTINFSDIRGGSLMMPNEENYYRGQVNKNSNNEIFDNNVESFFTSLFTFPSPEFKLRIKGFYGKKVEYSLLINDFRSSFNNQTGNFDATVKFIGKMYGVYTDIPMSYLIISPYCRYGGSNNQTIWELNDYRFDDGTPIPRFLDLKDRIITANNNIKTNLSQGLVEKFTKNENRKKALQTIQSSYDDFVKYFLRIKTKQNNVIVKNDVILCKSENGKCDYLYTHNSNELTTLSKNITNLIKSYNDVFSDEKLPFIEPLDKNNIIGEIDYKLVVKKVNDEVKYVYNEKKLDLNKCLNLKEILQKVSSTLKNEESETFFIVSGRKMKETLKKYIEDIQEITIEINNKTNEETKYKTYEVLGFEPTVKNMFKILMAHLDCFIKIYASFLSNVTGIYERKISDYGFSYNDLSDVSNRILKSEDPILPPFASFKNKETNAFCYPNTDVVNDILEETELIDSLLNGSFEFIEKYNETQKLEEAYNDNSISLIPTCLTDLLNTNNPYDIDFNSSDSSINVDWILTYFGIRCISKFLLENSNNINEKTFGSLEAYNFWRVNKNLRKEIIEKIKNESFNYTNFIEFLLGNTDNNPYIINNKPCYSYNINTDKLLIKNGSNLLLSGDYNFPSIIGRNFGHINTFIDDINDNSGRYSFKNGSLKNNRPYGFIDFIDEKELDVLDTNVNSIDLSSFCDDKNKENLIKIYIPNMKNVYNENYSILYNKQERTNFYQLYKKLETSIKEYELIKLKDVYENDFSEGNLSFIGSTINNIPIFFDEKLTPETFLSSIPFNYNKISTSLMNGNSVITLPYSFLLFVGMILDKIQTMNKDDFYNFYMKTIKTYSKSLSNNDDKKLLNDLYMFITFFTRKNNGEYNEKVFYGNYTKYEYISSILDDIYLDKQNKWFATDYLELVSLYKEWSESNDEGGFLYFKNHYQLSENFNFVVFNSDLKSWRCYDTFNGETMHFKCEGYNIYNRLIDFCKNNFSKFNNSDRDENIIKLINKCYKNVNGNESNTSFTDRYSTLSLIEEGSKLIVTFNKNFKAYESLNKFFSTNYKLVVPYSFNILYNKETDNIEYRPSKSIEVFKTAFNTFKSSLLTLYNNTNKIDNSNSSYVNETSYDVNEDNKLSMYRTLKNLYDKHFSDLLLKKDLYDLKKENNEFERFHFIDSFYNDLSNELNLNLESVIDLLNIITDGFESGKGEGFITSEMSVYSFMSLICQKHNMMLISMPFFNKKGIENFNDMFTPFTFNETLNDKTLNGPSYICFYPNQASQHLDIPSSQYSNDGFNISDINSVGGSSDVISDLEVVNDDDYVIPSFSVEYGSQKQSIFKNININMDNPQTTEIAVANTFALANSNNEDMRKMRFEGQDLYKIYSNYSYTCDVEMMGCAQIQPLMYFQLNNIPMFRGAYQIIQVSHNITPGNMTTSFKGIRLNKTKIPMVNNCISTAHMKQILNNQSNSLKNKKQQIMDIKKLPFANTRVHFMKTDFEVTSNKLIEDYKDYVIFGSGQHDAFNRLNPVLRKLIYCITGDIKELSKKLTYRLGIYISSSTRDSVVNGNNSSDHIINGTPSERRRSIKALDINGVEKSFAEMGCAIDFYGTKNGVIDKGEPSITLFSLIAQNYYEYIRQLIWEVKDQAVSQNNISLIHLASYGKVGSNGSDKNEIYVASYPQYSGVNTGYNNLPSEFLKILCDMTKLENFNRLRINNFGDNIPTIDILNDLYNKSILA